MRNLLYILVISLALPFLAFATEDETKLHHTVDIDGHIFEFDAPSLRYEVKTNSTYPIVASLMHRQEEAIITVVYNSFVTYGDVGIDYDFLKNHLKKNEKSYKKTKKNYNQISFEKTTIAGVAAPELVFATNSDGYWETSVVICFNDDLLVYFVSFECPEKKYEEYRPDFDLFLRSINLR
jgi:hypothetical protein